MIRRVDPEIGWVVAQCRGDSGEVYDLGADPFQLENIFRPNGGQPTVQRQLAAKLEELRDCVGIAGRDPQPPAGASYCE